MKLHVVWVYPGPGHLGEGFHLSGCCLGGLAKRRLQSYNSDNLATVKAPNKLAPGLGFKVLKSGEVKWL